jgi:hypothetical protein
MYGLRVILFIGLFIIASCSIIKTYLRSSEDLTPNQLSVRILSDNSDIYKFIDQKTLDSSVSHLKRLIRPQYPPTGPLGNIVLSTMCPEMSKLEPIPARGEITIFANINDSCIDGLENSVTATAGPCSYRNQPWSTMAGVLVICRNTVALNSRQLIHELIHVLGMVQMANITTPIGTWPGVVHAFREVSGCSGTLVMHTVGNSHWHPSIVPEDEIMVPCSNKVYGHLSAVTLAMLNGTGLMALQPGAMESAKWGGAMCDSKNGQLSLLPPAPCLNEFDALCSCSEWIIPHKITECTCGFPMHSDNNSGGQKLFSDISIIVGIFAVPVFIFAVCLVALIKNGMFRHFSFWKKNDLTLY